MKSLFSSSSMAFKVGGKSDNSLEMKCVVDGPVDLSHI